MNRIQFEVKGFDFKLKMKRKAFDMITQKQEEETHIPILQSTKKLHLPSGGREKRL